MKNNRVVLTGILFGGALFLTFPATAGLFAAQTKTEVQEDFSNLVQSESEIQKNLADIANSRKQLETDLLSKSGRASTNDLINKDKEAVLAYRAEALDDVEYLSAHLGGLTQAQRDMVAEVRVDLVYGSLAF